jgi:hypothetical protein
MLYGPANCILGKREPESSIPNLPIDSPRSATKNLLKFKIIIPALSEVVRCGRCMTWHKALLMVLGGKMVETAMHLMALTILLLACKTTNKSQLLQADYGGPNEEVFTLHGSYQPISELDRINAYGQELSQFLPSLQEVLAIAIENSPETFHPQMIFTEFLNKRLGDLMARLSDLSIARDSRMVPDIARTLVATVELVSDRSRRIPDSSRFGPLPYPMVILRNKVEASTSQFAQSIMPIEAPYRVAAALEFELFLFKRIQSASERVYRHRIPPKLAFALRNLDRKWTNIRSQMADSGLYHGRLAENLKEQAAPDSEQLKILSVFFKDAMIPDGSNDVAEDYNTAIDLHYSIALLASELAEAR